MPVDSIAMELTRHAPSQSARARRSVVNVGNDREGNLIDGLNSKAGTKRLAAGPGPTQ